MIDNVHVANRCREEKMGKKKRKGAAKVASVLQSGSFPYHPEEEYIDKVSLRSFQHHSAYREERCHADFDRLPRMCTSTHSRLPLLEIRTHLELSNLEG